jgi:hypothetical protein
MIEENKQEMIYTTSIKDGAFLFHKSFYQTYIHLKQKDPETAANFLDAILNYAFLNELPNENIDSDIWLFGGLPATFFIIDADAGRINQ